MDSNAYISPYVYTYMCIFMNVVCLCVNKQYLYVHDMISSTSLCRFLFHEYLILLQFKISK